MVQVDHSGHPAIKIVIHGPSRAGKTSLLKVLTALKRIEDPPVLVSELKKIQAPSGETVFFDKVTLLAGEIDVTKGHAKGTNIHIWTTPGGDLQRQQREIVFQGTSGFILLLTAESRKMNENIQAMQQIREYLDQILVPVEVMINKTDIEQPDLNEFARQLVENGIYYTENEARQHLHPVSVLQARDDLINLVSRSEFFHCLTKERRLKRECRPQSVDSLVQPIRAVLRVIIEDELKQFG